MVNPMLRIGRAMVNAWDPSQSGGLKPFKSQLEHMVRIRPEVSELRQMAEVPYTALHEGDDGRLWLRFDPTMSEEEAMTRPANFGSGDGRVFSSGRAMVSDPSNITGDFGYLRNLFDAGTPFDLAIGKDYGGDPAFEYYSFRPIEDGETVDANGFLVVKDDFDDYGV